MFVDDEELNLLLFEKRFENDFNIIVASSGKEALETLEKHAGNVKVVISDMRMPYMDGLQFIRLAREKFANIHYFILTGFNYNVELETALKEGRIDRLFSKPYDYETIIAAV